MQLRQKGTSLTADGGTSCSVNYPLSASYSIDATISCRLKSHLVIILKAIKVDKDILMWPFSDVTFTMYVMAK